MIRRRPGELAQESLGASVTPSLDMLNPIPCFAGTSVTVWPGVGAGWLSGSLGRFLSWEEPSTP